MHQLHVPVLLLHHHHAEVDVEVDAEVEVDSVELLLEADVAVEVVDMLLHHTVVDSNKVVVAADTLKLLNNLPLNNMLLLLSNLVADMLLVPAMVVQLVVDKVDTSLAKNK